MRKKAWLFIGLGVAVGVAVNILAQKLKYFEFELAELLDDEDDEDLPSTAG